MTVRIGISGWRYEPWRGVFYPKGLPQHQELAFASRMFPSVEINGSFYSLQRPKSYQEWYDATPPGFIFASKGNRFITHMRRLREPDQALCNVFASGVLALREKLGPFLWQVPPNLQFDAGVLEGFLRALPHDTEAALAMARFSGWIPQWLGFDNKWLGNALAFVAALQHREAQVQARRFLDRRIGLAADVHAERVAAGLALLHVERQRELGARQVAVLEPDRARRAALAGDAGGDRPFRFGTHGAAVAAVVAGNALLDKPCTKLELLQFAMHGEAVASGVLTRPGHQRLGAHQVGVGDRRRHDRAAWGFQSVRCARKRRRRFALPAHSKQPAVQSTEEFLRLFEVFALLDDVLHRVVALGLVGRLGDDPGSPPPAGGHRRRGHKD